MLQQMFNVTAVQALSTSFISVKYSVGRKLIKIRNCNPASFACCLLHVSKLSGTFMLSYNSLSLVSLFTTFCSHYPCYLPKPSVYFFVSVVETSGCDFMFNRNCKVRLNNLDAWNTPWLEGFLSL